MTMTRVLFLERGRLVTLLERQSRKMVVVAPVLVEGSPAFVSWHGQELALDAEPAFSSPAQLFLPLKEVLFRYIQYSGQYIFESPEPEKMLVVGIRPCDLQAVAILDKLFSGDTLYQSRRGSVLVAALNCTRPGRGCNCTNMGSGPECKCSYDLLLTEIESGYLVEAGSQVGEAMIQENAELFSEADGSCLDRKRELLKASEALGRSGPTLEEIREAMTSADWEELARACMSCGGCTFACPVCHCFNIIDLGVPDGERERCRDSCILSGFFRMAGGSNPKKSKGERMKNWHQDKFNLLPEKIGMVGCVGCGRCSRACLAGLDRTSLIHSISRKS